MKVTCPKCERPIAAASLNVATDVALCTVCDEAFVLSDLVDDGDEDSAELDEPPRGAWFRTRDDGWELGATTRSFAAIFLVPFTAVWAGGSMAGIYGTQIAKGRFEPVQSLFGIPFLLGSIFLGTLSLMTLFGKTVVTVTGDEGEVFTGIGILGWRRRLRWGEVTRVEEGPTSYRSSGSSNMQLTLVGKTRVKFGSMWSDARRYFVYQVLRRMLRGRK